MSILQKTDGVDTFDAADLLLIQQQGVARYSTFTAASLNLVASAAPITGQLIQILDDGRVLRYNGVSWDVYAAPKLSIDISGTSMTTNVSAASSTQLSSLPMGVGVYQVSGSLECAATFNLTSLFAGGSITGRWGITGAKQATTFDKTSGSSVVPANPADSLLLFGGRVTVVTAGSWNLFGFNTSTISPLLAQSFFTVERVA